MSHPSSSPTSSYRRRRGHGGRRLVRSGFFALVALVAAPWSAWPCASLVAQQRTMVARSAVMPRLIDLRLDRARSQFQELKLGTLSVLPAGVGEGVVVRQLPAAGDTVFPPVKATVWVRPPATDDVEEAEEGGNSLGEIIGGVAAAALSTLLDRDTGQRTVPEIVGLPLDSARMQFKAVDIAIPDERVGRAPSEVEAGRIIAQSPEAGAPVQRGMVGRVTVSAGAARMPALVGRPLAGALDLLRQLPVRLSQVDTVASGAASGLVVRQEPTAGTPLLRPARGRLWVSAGPVVGPDPDPGPGPGPGPDPGPDEEDVSPDPVRARVPTLIDRPLDAAVAAVAEAGLSLGAVTHVESGSSPGTIVDQAPAAGALVVPGTAVGLVVSLGPRATVAIPDVVGRPLPEAREAMVAAGLPVAAVDSAVSPLERGLIAEQTPAAGTPVAPGSPVRLAISLGAAIAVPELVGLTRTEAERVLAAVGLSGTFRQVDGEGEAGTVVAQVPAAGNAVPLGAIIQIDALPPGAIPWPVVGGTLLALVVLLVGGKRRLNPLVVAGARVAGRRLRRKERDGRSDEGEDDEPALEMAVALGRADQRIEAPGEPALWRGDITLVPSAGPVATRLDHDGRLEEEVLDV